MSAPPTPPPGMPQAKESRFKPMGTPCERADSYRPGGFHPVNLGDVLQDRYHVIRKLGYGSFATVWLAEDLSLSGFIALKIHAANVDASKELALQQQLNANCLDDPDSKFVLLLSDHFTIEGPNGKHLCFVTKAMGPSISAVLNAPFELFDPLNPPTRRFPTPRNKRILRGILSGLKFLHGNQVVHGDLQLGNVLFPPKDLTELQKSGLEQNESNSQLDLLVRKDGLLDRWSPKYLVVPKPLDEADLGQDAGCAKLIDLGGGNFLTHHLHLIFLVLEDEFPPNLLKAFHVNSPPDSVVTPLDLRAPETIFHDNPSPAIDVWSFGCIMFRLLTDNVLFHLFAFGGQRDVIDDDHLLQLSEIIGPLPEGMLAKWTRHELYFGPDGNRLSTRPLDFDESSVGQAIRAKRLGRGPPPPPPPLSTLEEKFHKYRPDDINAAEAKEISALLREIFAMDPLDRPSAAELLGRPWFQIDDACGGKETS